MISLGADGAVDFLRGMLWWILYGMAGLAGLTLLVLLSFPWVAKVFRKAAYGPGEGRRRVDVGTD